MLNTPSNLPGQDDSSCFCRGGMSKIKYISKFLSGRKTKGSLFFLHLTMLNPANNTTKKVLANLGFRSFNTIKVYVFATSMQKDKCTCFFCKLRIEDFHNKYGLLLKLFQLPKFKIDAPLFRFTFLGFINRLFKSV